MKAPKVALVCDWLTTVGGAERVLKAFHELYPSAPIYTSQYRQRGIDWFTDAEVKTGWLNFFPAKLRRILGPLRQLYFSHLDLSSYDLVISVTGAEAKSVKTAGKHHQARHICYCHVPTQYYWGFYDRYLENPGFGLLNPVVRFFFKALVKPLRRADYRAAQRPDYFVSISNYAAEEITKYYKREVKVIHPPVSTNVFRTPVENSKIKKGIVKPQKPEQPEQYYLNFSRQVSWKRLDLAIKACLRLKRPLVLIGSGPEHNSLVKLAQNSPLITFLPEMPQSDLKTYLQRAKAFIFPSQEPFGIAPLEALAAGCPVIAYGAGGALDFIEDGKNGLLFERQSINSLASAITTFEDLPPFPPQELQASAERFSETHFIEHIKEFINEVIT